MPYFTLAQLLTLPRIVRAADRHAEPITTTADTDGVVTITYGPGDTEQLHPRPGRLYRLDAWIFTRLR